MKSPKSHWNHRVLRFANQHHGGWFAIHEVYYRKGVPESYTVEPCKITAESLEDLRWMLEQMLLALDKPILDGDNFPKEYKPTTQTDNVRTI